MHGSSWNHDHQDRLEKRLSEIVGKYAGQSEALRWQVRSAATFEAKTYEWRRQLDLRFEEMRSTMQRELRDQRAVDFSKTIADGIQVQFASLG